MRTLGLGSLCRRWLNQPEVLAWGAVGPLAGLATARVLRYEGRALLAVANAATRFAYLPAWGALAVGVARRRPALTAIAGSVAFAHTLWAGPELRRRRPLGPHAPVASQLRVWSANLRFTAPDWEAAAVAIAASGADVVFLQELTPMNLVVLQRAGAFDGYEHFLADPRARSFGSGIWSRYPLSAAEVWWIGSHPMTRARVEIGGIGVRLVNVHTRSPLVGGLHLWHEQLGALARVVKEPCAAEAVVMAGDFNATFGNPGFRRILAAGMRDAHVDAGRGLTTTWPVGMLLPPAFRIDHVLVAGAIEVVDAGVAGAGESDHRPVWADLILTARRHAGDRVGEA